jgi:hypothetical protein
MLADAASRSSYLAQGGGDYGNANGFRIMDASGNNSLTVGGALQFRYNISLRDDNTNPNDQDFTVGFTTPLTRLRASGTVGTRELGYKVQATFGGSDGVGAIDDAFATWDFGNGWQAKMGQFNLPVVREISIGAEDHLGSDFSIFSQVFGQGYSQGLMATYSEDQFRVMLAFSDGAGTANTDFDSGNEADFAFSIRGEFLALGNDWNMFNNYTSWQNTNGDNVLVGGALHYQTGGSTGFTSDVDNLILTVDATWEGPGYNVTGAFAYANTDFGGGGDRSDFGFMLQGGYFFNPQTEVFARYDGIYFDDDAVPAGLDETANFITAGVNWYLFPESNAGKFTAQAIFALNETNGTLFGGGGTVFDDGNTNALLGDSEDGEVGIQFMWQTIF